jgi:type I restriction enzyme S subunit
MHDGWSKIALGEVVEVKHGWPFKSDMFSEELSGRPVVVNIGNFRYTGGFRFESTTVKEYRGDYPSEYELRSGDILLVMTCQTPGGEILGIPGRIPHDGRTYLHNQRMGKVVVQHANLADENYLYYLFTSPDFNRHLVTTSSGTKILHTSPGRIQDYEFWIPPIHEQRAIAEVLGALDDKIELNRRINETLGAMARAIFKSWFVDFDPVRAKADGRQPAGMSADIANLFPSKLKAGVPGGWRPGQLGEVAENKRTQVKPGEAPAESPYVGLEHMPRKCIALAEWDAADEVASNKFAFSTGDILFGKLRPYFHKVGVAAVDGVCSTDVLVIGAKTSAWFGYVLGHLSSDELIAYTDGASTGTKMPRTSWNDLARYETVMPTGDVARAFNQVISPMIYKIRNNIHESRTLAQLRDTLLPKLLSGEVRLNQDLAAKAAQEA